MKRFIKYNSIGKYSEVVKNITHESRFLGLDENGNPKYGNKKLPTIKATGSEKLHGTNGAVSYSHPDGMWFQSRKNIITSEKDNAGCAFNCENNSISWMKIIDELINEYNINCHKYIISIYFEWCGGNIQKKSAVSGLEKRAVIFQHFKVSPINPIVDKTGEEEGAYWLETCTTSDDMSDAVHWLEDEDNDIYNIMAFPTYEIEINFNEALLSQNEMIRLVEEVVEPNSPVGKKFGKEGNVGEGIVFTINVEGIVHKWKVKGEEHSNTKVTKLKVVDEVKEKNKIEFANHATPGWRLTQMWQEVFGIENEKMEPSTKATGDFLRLVHQDIMKEERDELISRGLEPKEVNGMISKIARNWFLEEIDKHNMSN